MKDIAERYDDYMWEQESKLEKYPICECCGEHIQTECYYLINGDYYCEDCIDEMKHYTDVFED